MKKDLPEHPDLNRLIEFYQGGLSDEEYDLIESHLDQCENCSDVVDGIQDFLLEGGTVEEILDIEDESYDVERSSIRSRRPIWHYGIVVAAASIFLAILLQQTNPCCASLETDESL